MTTLLLMPAGDSACSTILERVPGEIAHAIAGRVRVRVPRLKWDSIYASQLVQQLQALTWVGNVQVNAAAACLVLTYDQSQFPDQPIPPPEMFMVIQRVSGLEIASAPAAAPPDPTLDSLNLFQFDPQATQIHLKTVGGGLIGAAAGDLVGGVVGATAGAIVLGPPGAILGGQLGVFVGGVIGAQIGAETVHHVDRLTQLASIQPGELTPQKIAATLQKRAGEKIGETAGQAFGGVMGRVFLGPPGLIAGVIVGGAIGSQFGEETASTPQAAPPLVPADSQHPLAPPNWLAQTTQRFISETAAATVGGALGRLVLGPAGQRVGIKLGNRIFRIIEANTDRSQPIAPAKHDNPPA